MKNIIFLILALIIYNNLMFSQDKNTIKGNYFHKAYSFLESIDKYEKVKNKTIDIKRNLADAYFKTGNYFKAEEYLKEISSSLKCTSEDIYNYASVLLINEKYTDAELWMEKFATMERGDSRAKQFMNNKNYYNELLKDNYQFKIANLDMNSEQQDFGTSYYLDKVVFTSSRTKSKFIKRIWSWNKLPFLDLYIADNEKTKLTKIKRFKRAFNKKYHEGPASFTKKGDFMAFTQNNYKAKTIYDIVKLQIFISKKEGNKWTKAEPVHFNSNKYSVGHPSLTPDGNTMYFASDMPGGYGGVDIWLVRKTSNGKWGKPKNLGHTINTEGNEMFPFIHESGLLFYSSDGLLGLGGLDIFYTKLNNDKYLAPKNIGVPINSSYDDFAFILDRRMTRGYFSSNRMEGRGSDDIYSFKLLKELTFDAILKGKIIDNNTNVLANANVSLYDTDGNIIKTINSNSNGEFSFKINPKLNYRLIGSKPKYIRSTKEVNINSENAEEYVTNLTLEKLPDFTLICSVLEEKSSYPISDVNIICINNKNNKTENLKTFDSGKFLVKLRDVKLNDTINYSFILEKRGYAPQTIIYSQLLYRIGEYKKTIKMQKIEIGEDLGKILAIKPIYFDFDKSNIRPDAAIELDKIVKIMNEYPNMLIQLSSHTDCRGSGIYNLKLSDRRAKASAHYIKTRISKPTRIYGEGYGEKKLIIKCKSCNGESLGKKCTEKDHQKNRRTEFKIIRK